MPQWVPLSAILDAASRAAGTRLVHPEDFCAYEHRKIIEIVVNVMAPLENAPIVRDVGDTTDEQAEPEQMGVNRMRHWLQDKLIAIGFAPKTEKSAADDSNFDSYLAPFSRSEQQAIFGASNIHRYHKGDLTWQGLVRELEHLATSSTEQLQGDMEQLSP